MRTEVFVYADWHESVQPTLVGTLKYATVGAAPVEMSNHPVLAGFIGILCNGDPV